MCLNRREVADLIYDLKERFNNMKISSTDKFKLINVKATFSVLKQQKKKFKFGSFGSKRKTGFGFHLLAKINSQ